ncbi:unnamed protein product [Schistosoma guineensis]|nr:unnamed protein product [Schistosoma guineensis]
MFCFSAWTCKFIYVARINQRQIIFVYASLKILQLKDFNFTGLIRINYSEIIDMTVHVPYSAWSEQCRALLEVHSKLDALCVCDHGSRVLGSAFKIPEFASITNLSTNQVRAIRLVMAKIGTQKLNIDFLNDRFVVIDANNEMLSAKSGKKSLFVELTKTLCVFGLSMDTETENKHATALEAMRDIQKYYEDAEF